MMSKIFQISRKFKTNFKVCSKTITKCLVSYRWAKNTAWRVYLQNLLKFLFFDNMLQLQVLGGCLTRRPEILVTLQSPAEIVLSVIFDIMIYFTQQINSVCLSIIKFKENCINLMSEFTHI